MPNLTKYGKRKGGKHKVNLYLLKSSASFFAKNKGALVKLVNFNT